MWASTGDRDRAGVSGAALQAAFEAVDLGKRLLDRGEDRTLVALGRGGAGLDRLRRLWRQGRGLARGLAKLADEGGIAELGERSPGALLGEREAAAGGGRGEVQARPGLENQAVGIAGRALDAGVGGEAGAGWDHDHGAGVEAVLGGERGVGAQEGALGATQAVGLVGAVDDEEVAGEGAQGLLAADAGGAVGMAILSSSVARTFRGTNCGSRPPGRTSMLPLVMLPTTVAVPFGPTVSRMASASI